MKNENYIHNHDKNEIVKGLISSIKRKHMEKVLMVFHFH